MINNSSGLHDPLVYSDCWLHLPRWMLILIGLPLLKGYFLWLPFAFHFHFKWNVIYSAINAIFISWYVLISKNNIYTEGTVWHKIYSESCTVYIAVMLLTCHSHIDCQTLSFSSYWFNKMVFVTTENVELIRWLTSDIPKGSAVIQKLLLILSGLHSLYHAFTWKHNCATHMS